MVEDDGKPLVSPPERRCAVAPSKPIAIRHTPLALMSIADSTNPRPPLSGFRWLIAWSILPATLLVSLGACAAILGSGHAEGGSSPVAHGWIVLAISVAVGMFLLVMERVQPHSRYWRKPQGDIGTDITHVVLSSLLIPAIFEAAVKSLLLAGAAWLATRVGGSLWPTSWPLAIQLTLALIVAELGQYWWHRTAHERETLWRFHATHHSPRRLYWLNSCRFHPVDSMAQYLLEAVPLVLLGCSPVVLALFTLATAVIGMFQHANIELRAGWLNWVFSLTELHRWHHSREIREGNSNYGANLIVWDVVFGTRYLPAGREVAAENVGLSANMVNFPRDYVGQLLSPFRWARYRRRKPTPVDPESQSAAAPPAHRREPAGASP
jgi:sterol desaturase/sphingolipid hydroxylase (fatty acid hydroxylase superfamily)